MKYFFFILFSSICFAQNVSFIYESKMKISSENPKGGLQKTILDIDGNLSIFREEIDKKGDSLSLVGKNGMSVMGVEHQYYVKKTPQETDKLITFLGVNYIIPITDKLDWKISSEKKTIANYKAQKAEVNYGGRNWTAWFTTDLPFSDGPYIFRGLPGMIISIEDEKDDYSFRLVEVKKTKNIFDARTKTVKIDWNQYEKLAKSYYNDPYDLNSKVGKRVYMTDAQGNSMDLKEVAKSAQQSILKENNPIELNHKIQYK